MNVLYDYQAFWFQKYGGVSRYFSCLMDYSKKTSSFNFTNSTIFSNNIYLKKKKVFPFLPEYDFVGKNSLFFGLKYLNMVNCLKLANTNSFDVFHPTYYEDYFLNKIRIPFILTFHDLTMEKYSELFTKRVLFFKEKKRLLEKTSKIITVSNNTKKDLIQHYDVNKDKIEVVYLGSNINKKLVMSIKEKIPQKFILFVGARSGYKNFDFFITSIYSLLKKDKDLFLVCVGKPFEENEKKLFDKFNINKKALYIQANDNELAYLYTKAKLFVFPSLYEGFGIPILEAFNCGCPVALSNTSCFPEIANKAGLYFDPTNSVSIKNAVEELLTNNTKRKIFIKKGINRAKNFSWEKTAINTKKVYEKIL